MLFFIQEMSMRQRNVWIGTVAIAFAASVVACGGGPSNTSAPPSAPAGTPAGQKVDTSVAGKVSGTVVVDGAVPKNDAIKMNADPVCVRENKEPQFQATYVVGGDGKSLGNVFVYVKDGLGNYVYDTPTDKATIDQKNCRYHPHVFGVRVNQPIEIINSDPTLHNIHALPKGNSEFNTGQPIQGMKMTHTFDKKEVMVPFKCDVHSWMNAYVGVLDHPYFAVTKDDGKFELKDLPAGSYTIEAWHEKLGTQEVKVTLAEKESKEVTFTFKPVATTTNN
jgi:plastocyanin